MLSYTIEAIATSYAFTTSNNNKSTVPIIPTMMTHRRNINPRLCLEAKKEIASKLIEGYKLKGSGEVCFRCQMPLMLAKSVQQRQQQEEEGGQGMDEAAQDKGICVVCGESEDLESKLVMFSGIQAKLEVDESKEDDDGKEDDDDGSSDQDCDHSMTSSSESSMESVEDSACQGEDDDTKSLATNKEEESGIGMDQVKIQPDQYDENSPIINFEVSLRIRCKCCGMDIPTTEYPCSGGSSSTTAEPSSSFYRPYGSECAFCHVAKLGVADESIVADDTIASHYSAVKYELNTNGLIEEKMAGEDEHEEVLLEMDDRLIEELNEDAYSKPPVDMILVSDDLVACSSHCGPSNKPENERNDTSDEDLQVKFENGSHLQSPSRVASESHEESGTINIAVVPAHSMDKEEQDNDGESLASSEHSMTDDESEATDFEEQMETLVSVLNNGEDIQMSDEDRRIVPTSNVVHTSYDDVKVSTFGCGDNENKDAAVAENLIIENQSQCKEEPPSVASPVKVVLVNDSATGFASTQSQDSSMSGSDKSTATRDKTIAVKSLITKFWQQNQIDIEIEQQKRTVLNDNEDAATNQQDIQRMKVIEVQKETAKSFTGRPVGSQSEHQKEHLATVTLVEHATIDGHACVETPVHDNRSPSFWVCKDQKQEESTTVAPVEEILVNSNDHDGTPSKKATTTHRDKNTVVKRLIAKYWQQNLNEQRHRLKSKQDSKTNDGGQDNDHARSNHEGVEDEKSDLYSDLVECRVSKGTVDCLRELLEAPRDPIYQDLTADDGVSLSFDTSMDEIESSIATPANAIQIKPKDLLDSGSGKETSSEEIAITPRTEAPPATSPSPQKTMEPTSTKCESVPGIDPPCSIDPPPSMIYAFKEDPKEGINDEELVYTCGPGRDPPAEETEVAALPSPTATAASAYAGYDEDAPHMDTTTHMEKRDGTAFVTESCYVDYNRDTSHVMTRDCISVLTSNTNQDAALPIHRGHLSNNTNVDSRDQLTMDEDSVRQKLAQLEIHFSQTDETKHNSYCVNSNKSTSRSEQPPMMDDDIQQQLADIDLEETELRQQLAEIDLEEIDLRQQLAQIEFEFSKLDLEQEISRHRSNSYKEGRESSQTESRSSGLGHDYQSTLSSTRGGLATISEGSTYTPNLAAPQRSRKQDYPHCKWEGPQLLPLSPTAAERHLRYKKELMAKEKSLAMHLPLGSFISIE